MDIMRQSYFWYGFLLNCTAEGQVLNGDSDL